MTTVHDLRDTLAAIADRAQTALDGTGARPWSPEYILEIVREIRDMAQSAASDEDE